MRTWIPRVVIRGVKEMSSSLQAIGIDAGADFGLSQLIICSKYFFTGSFVFVLLFSSFCGYKTRKH